MRGQLIDPDSSWFTEAGDVNVSYIFSFGGDEFTPVSRNPQRKWLHTGLSSSFPL